jgi:hypothetical protein
MIPKARLREAPREGRRGVCGQPPRARRTLPSGAPRTVPFVDAQEAWLWTMAALVARREGSPRGVDGAGRPRPAMPEDVLRCLDTLYRNRRIDLLHVRILRIWGERGMAPAPERAAERSDAQIWREALQRLEWPLRVKGLIAAARAK